MDKKSVLFIEVPLENVMLNNKSDLQLLKKHWNEHINFYSKKSLYRLIKNVELDVIDFRIIQNTGEGNSLYLFQVSCRLISL